MDLQILMIFQTYNFKQFALWVVLGDKVDKIQGVANEKLLTEIINGK